MKKMMFFILLLLAPMFLLTAFSQESLTITTYYPAPFGVYSSLRLFPGAPPICDANNEGVMYYDNDNRPGHVPIHQLRVCTGDGHGGFAWQNAGGLWTLETPVAPGSLPFIHPNTGTWNVGIGALGTDVPSAELEVRGRAVISRIATDTNDLGARTLTLGPRPDGAPYASLGLQEDANNKAVIEYGNLGLAGGLGIGTFRGYVAGGSGLWTESPPYSIFITKAGDVGMGTVIPQAKLDVVGEIKVGSTGLPCNANTAGATRYNTGTHSLQYCDGTTWRRIGGYTSFKFADPKHYAQIPGGGPGPANCNFANVPVPACDAGWTKLASVCEAGTQDWVRWIVLCGQE